MLLKNFFKRTPTTRMFFFLTNDVIWISLSVYLAFFLRFEGQIPYNYYNAIIFVTFAALLFCIPIFYFNKLYSFSWSFVSAEELISLFKSTVLAYAFLVALLFILKEQFFLIGFPRSTLFVSFFSIFVLSGGVRFSKRIYLQLIRKKEKKGKERTLIIGAGDAGEQVLRSISTLKSDFFNPIGFIDDGFMKQGVLIHGLKVLGKIADIPKVVRENEITGMIIALPSAGSEVIKKAVEKGRETGLRKIKIIPPLTKIVDGQISIGDLKDLKIEDLLGREPIYLDYISIKDFVKDKKILITGAAGSIGSELCRQVAKFKPDLIILFDQDETGIFNISKELKSKFPDLKFSSEIADICDQEKVEYIFNNFKPEIVFHAAAYKHVPLMEVHSDEAVKNNVFGHVPLMEVHSDEAVKNNVFGTEILAETALKHKAEKVIFISTDKAVKPSSVMGATKRIGEMVCQNLNKRNSTKFISVRFGNVLDSRGSVIPVFKEQIKRGGPVEITHPDMKRYFMMISEACLLVMQAAEMGKGGEVFVLDMGKPVKILDLAKELIKLSGFEPDKEIPIVFTNPRPGEKLCFQG